MFKKYLILDFEWNHKFISLELFGKNKDIWNSLNIVKIL